MQDSITETYSTYGCMFKTGQVAPVSAQIPCQRGDGGFQVGMFLTPAGPSPKELLKKFVAGKKDLGVSFVENLENFTVISGFNGFQRLHNESLFYAFIKQIFMRICYAKCSFFVSQNVLAF